MNSGTSKGFTMIELLIVMGISGFVVTLLFSLYLNANRSYHLQEQFTDQSFNAHFAATRLVEVLQEAGADLPIEGTLEIIGWQESATDSSDTLTLLVNKFEAAEDQLTTACGTDTVYVANAGQFARRGDTAGSIIIYNTADSTYEIRKLLSIDTTAPHCKAIQCLAVPACTTTMAAPDEFSVMAIDTVQYYRNDSNYFVMKTDIENQMAENIIRLKVDLLNGSGTALAAPTWDSIKFAEVTVGTATAATKSGSTEPYKKENTYTVVLRNR